MTHRFVRYAAIGMTALSLSACGDSSSSQGYTAPASSAHPAPSSGSTATVNLGDSKIPSDKDGTPSTPSHRNWRQTFANDSYTVWRCAGTTLLIKDQYGYDGDDAGIAALANDPRCQGDS